MKRLIILILLVIPFVVNGQTYRNAKFYWNDTLAMNTIDVLEKEYVNEKAKSLENEIGQKLIEEYLKTLTRTYGDTIYNELLSIQNGDTTYKQYIDYPLVVKSAPNFRDFIKWLNGRK